MGRRAMQVCPCTECPAHPGSCPTLTPGGRCPACGRQADLARGSRQDRGYDREHDRLRRQWTERVEQGGVECHQVQCLMPTRAIEPGSLWDLGHTADRTGWTGPEHPLCNRSDGGRAAHGRR